MVEKGLEASSLDFEANIFFPQWKVVKQAFLFLV